MSTELPYEIDQKYDLLKILEGPHEIPYHSRPFMWTREHHIEHVVRQAIQKFREGKPYWLGFVIIYLKKGRIPSVSDAQHRLTIFFLVYITLCNLLNEPKYLDKVSRSESDNLLDEMSEKDAELMEQYEWTRMPMIQSVYAQDLEALGNILNNKVPEDTTTSKIYDAHGAVRDILTESLHPEEYASFFKCISRSTKVTRMVITDWDFALEMFDALNNIKVTVPPLYLLKNAIARCIGESHSMEIHRQFCEWETAVGSGESFDKFIHTTANMYTGTFSGVNDYIRGVEKHLVTQGASAFRTFTEMGQRVLMIHRFIQDHPMCQILKKLASGHEVINYCLIPLFVKAPSFTAVLPIVRQIIAFGIRTPGRCSFNPLKRLNALIGPTGSISALMENRQSFDQTGALLTDLLRNWLPAESDFAVEFANESLKDPKQFTKARCALLFAMELTDTHEASFNHGLIDIDHVSPKKPRKTDEGLANPANLHRIGNFTPFVGKNSDSGLSGNRSLGNKPYTEKRGFYKSSNIAMTRDLAHTYDVFADEEIEKRSRELASLLDGLTKKELGL